MIDYRQPTFYRFNEDSLHLVKLVLGQVSHCNHLLDLGAGCGVMGIELAKNLSPSHLSLLELQEDFRPFLEQNITDFCPPQTQASIIISSFSHWKPDRKFDLIVCNPPYYLPHKGQPSQDERRGKARSLMVDDWPTLLNLIKDSLASDGAAFIVLKDEKEFQVDVSSGLKCEKNFSENLIFLKLTL